MLVSQMLRYARALLASGWCQAAEARDEFGEPVEPWDVRAASWSPLGALLAVAHDAEADGVAVGLAATALALVLERRADELPKWNDDALRTQQDVLAAFEQAIALLPQLADRYQP